MWDLLVTIFFLILLTEYKHILSTQTFKMPTCMQIGS